MKPKICDNRDPPSMATKELICQKNKLDIFLYQKKEY